MDNFKLFIKINLDTNKNYDLLFIASSFTVSVDFFCNNQKSKEKPGWKSVVYIGITNEKRKFFLNDKNSAHTFIMFLFLEILYDWKEYESVVM